MKLQLHASDANCHWYLPATVVTKQVKGEDNNDLISSIGLMSLKWVFSCIYHLLEPLLMKTGQGTLGTKAGVNCGIHTHSVCLWKGICSPWKPKFSFAS